MRQRITRLVGDERVRFLLTGGFNTVFGYLLFAGIQFAIGQHIGYVVSVVLAQLIGSTVAFFLYRRFVFRVSGNHVVDYLRFQTVYIVPLLCNLVVLPLLVELLHWNVYIAQAGFTLALTVVSYVGHKFFSFRRSAVVEAPGVFSEQEEAALSEVARGVSTDESRSPWWAREWIIYLASFVITGVVTAKALNLRAANWSIPFRYDSDAVGTAAQIKTTVMTGWYESQPLLSAPHGQVFHDYSTADDFGLYFTKLIALFTHDWAFIMNLYYVLGFFAAALAAVWFLRVVGMPKVLAVVLSVLYAIAPYHFYRGENHLWLSGYFVIPLAMTIVYRALSGAPLWGRRAGSTGAAAWLRGPVPVTVIVLALTATTSSYYGVFTIVFLAFAGIISWVATRSWKRLWGAAAAAVVVVIAMLANMAPDLIYSRVNGTDLSAVIRPAGSTEGFSLKLAQLLLPVPGSRITVLEKIREFYDAYDPVPNEDPSLGIIGALGLIALIALALYFIVARGAAELDPLSTRSRLKKLATLAVFGVLLSSVGGFATFLGLFTNSLRGWNRLSIVLALFSLAAFGLLVDWLVRRVFRNRLARFAIGRAATVVVIAVLVLAVGYLDQVTPGSTPAYAAVKTAYQSDASFVGGIAKASGAKAKILQLPYREYPESGSTTGVPDTDQLKFFLHSDTLSWSGGGIKGRPYADWVDAAQALPAESLTVAASAAGFGGIVVDRRSYDTAKARDKVVEGLTASLGSPALVSSDGRYDYFTLAKAHARVDSQYSTAEATRVGDELVSPVTAVMQPAVAIGTTAVDLFKPYHPQILLQNPRSTSVTVTLDFTLDYELGDGVMRFTYGGVTKDVAVSPKDRKVTITVDARPGRSTVDLAVVSGPALPTRIPVRAIVGMGPIVVHDLQLEGQLGIVAKP